MNGVRDEFFSGARLAANQNRGARVCDLRDLLIDLPHRSCSSDDIREVVSLSELLQQMTVLVHQPAPLIIDEMFGFNRLRHHCRDKAETFQFRVVVSFRREF